MLTANKHAASIIPICFMKRSSLILFSYESIHEIFVKYQGNSGLTFLIFPGMTAFLRFGNVKKSLVRYLILYQHYENRLIYFFIKDGCSDVELKNKKAASSQKTLPLKG
jgi:hypothetical protein